MHLVGQYKLSSVFDWICPTLIRKILLSKIKHIPAIFFRKFQNILLWYSKLNWILKTFIKWFFANFSSSFFMKWSKFHKIRWTEAGKSLVIRSTIKKVWHNSPTLPFQVINSTNKIFYHRPRTFYLVLLMLLLEVFLATEPIFQKVRKSYLIQEAISSNSKRNHLLVRFNKKFLNFVRFQFG